MFNLITTQIYEKNKLLPTTHPAIKKNPTNYENYNDFYAGLFVAGIGKPLCPNKKI